MARAPSYDFERRERQKAKAAKRAEKTKAKTEKKDAETAETNVFSDGPDAARQSNDNEPR